MLSGLDLLVYTAQQDQTNAERCLRQFGEVRSVTFVHSWDEIRQQLANRIPSLFIVTVKGAAGMEGVFLARKLRPVTPVFWFSDDKDFCIQSHRLECEYFAQHPITPEKLTSALHRCAHVGVAFPLENGGIRYV